MAESVVDYHKQIVAQIKRGLTMGASAYLKTGMSLLHDELKARSYLQPAVGNLGIAVELMLKLLIANANPLLVFRELPQELRVLFAAPQSLPADFNWRLHDIDLRAFTHKTIELEECIGLFYILAPQHRQLLQPYFRLLSRCRNCSIHAALPAFQRYDLERTGYLALKLLEILKMHKVVSYEYMLSKKDERFLSSYLEARTERVRKAVEAAKTRSKELSEEESEERDAETWEEFVIECPICGCPSLLGGSTELSGEEDEDGMPQATLEFKADSFKCNGCGLVLNDVEELRLAGMGLVYGRGEDMEKWLEDFGMYEGEYL
jgi:hypothetical protein